jgi:hypothetical protein
MWKLTLGYSIFLHGEIFHFHLEGTEPLGQVGGGLLSPNFCVWKFGIYGTNSLLLWQDFL